MKTLVIVESPAKCAKIQNYLGPGYIVKASFGHICNLDTKKGLDAIDINNHYKPKFINIKEKKKYIDDLKKHAQNCDEVIIASDLDREGEAIGYHVCRVLNLDIKKTKRIVFNEITKKAIQQAVKDYREIDMNLVNAQQARQILDFVIGFDISPVLWKFIKSGISAGRCQTPALRLVNEKEESIDKFKSTNYFDLQGTFTIEFVEDIDTRNGTQECSSTVDFQCKYSKKLKNKNVVMESLEKYKTSNFQITNITMTESKSKSGAPFITSTLQQECSNKLSVPPAKTMQIAQKLYEGGLITYMRTDSKIISEDCLDTIKQYVTETFGDNFYKQTRYKNDSNNTQEAHECIRPVDIHKIDISDDFTSQEKKVYQLIWRRTVASQMSDSITQVMKVVINDNQVKYPFDTEFTKTLHLGYLKAYGEASHDDITFIKDDIEVGDTVEIDIITSEEKSTKSTARYTEASLIKDLEKKGIARPSTFASIIDTLFKREYIVKESRKGSNIEISIFQLKNNEIIDKKHTVKSGTETNKIFMTELGKKVIEFMNQHFDNIINYEFTADLEKQLDTIADGNCESETVIDSTYKSFHPKVVELKDKPGGIGKQDTVWDKKEFKSKMTTSDGENVYVFKGKYGPVIQIGEEDTKKYIGIPNDTDIKTITNEEIIEFLNYPKCLGKIDGKDVTMYVGNNGYYIKYNNRNFGANPQITLDECKLLIEEKKQNGLVKTVNDKMSIRNGPHGPYIMVRNLKKPKDKPKFITIPPEYHDKLDKLNLKQCNEIVNSGNSVGGKGKGKGKGK